MREGGLCLSGGFYNERGGIKILYFSFTYKKATLDCWNTISHKEQNESNKEQNWGKKDRNGTFGGSVFHENPSSESKFR